MTIENDMWYSPRAIEKHKLLQTRLGAMCYNTVLDMVSFGELKAKNVGRGKTPYYLIQGAELERFQREHQWFTREKENR